MNERDWAQRSASLGLLALLTTLAGGLVGQPSAGGRTLWSSLIPPEDRWMQERGGAQRKTGAATRPRPANRSTMSPLHNEDL